MAKRRSLSPREKALVRDRQKHLCGCGCGERLEGRRSHFDHAVPLWGGGSNELDNFVCLLVRHHMDKTAKEAGVRAKADRQGGKTGQWARRKKIGGSKLKGRGFDAWRGLDGSIRRK